MMNGFQRTSGLASRACVFGLMAGSLLWTGCSRQFWRHQADKDTYQAISQHINDPRWAVPRFDVTPDERSRFFDPYNPDFAPLPPDDPAAHTYMHWVDGWEGYDCWHKFGSLMSVENPQWLANFGITEGSVDPETGEFIAPVPELKEIKLQDAVELAQIHNRDYQFQIENVYLAALAVTFERFQFGVRYLGTSGSEPGGTITNTFVPHGPGDNTRMTSRFGFSQLLPAGTQWAVELANNTIWFFGAGTRTQTMSTLSYSLVQPLLVGAGRKVGLENLTQIERSLVYELRDLARFRQELFTDVVGSGSGFLNLLQQVQRIRNQYENIRRLEEQTERLLAQATQGNQSAGVDLDFPPAGGQTALEAIPPELLPYLDEPPAGLEPAPSIRGRIRFYPSLKRLNWSGGLISDEQIRILRNLSEDPVFNRAVDELIGQLRSEVAPLDVLNLQSQLASSINQVRESERGLQDNLDNFKILLGLPPEVELTIDDGLLEQFQLIDPQLTELENQANEFVLVWGQYFDEPTWAQLDSVVDSFSQLLSNLRTEGFSNVERDLERVEEMLTRREETAGKGELDESRENLQRARFLYESAQAELEEFQSRVKVFRQRTAAGLKNPEQEKRRDELRQLEELQDTDPVKWASEVEARGFNPLLYSDTREELRDEINALRLELLQLGQNLASIQVSLRVELVEVVPFDISLQTATQVGVDNRVDLMNSRALVMDARRQIEIAANRLKGVLDLVVDGEINTINRNKPFDFRGEESRLRAGLRFTAPLDQIDERNAYRAALIDYQRQRRTYMLAEDRVKADIRRAWRQLQVLKQNLETSKRAVRIAALQFDAAVGESNAPVSAQGGGRSSGVQGQNLLRALNDILNAQNSLLGNWISYEQNRLNIYRDMGIMDIGPDGVWNDEVYRKIDETDDQFLPPPPEVFPPDVPATELNTTGGAVELELNGPDLGRADWGSLGGGVAVSGVVALPDRTGIVRTNAEEPGDRKSGQAKLPDQSVRAGIYRQPE
ncbi:MAG: TolC family protein [Planctomycetaceae bacterium]|nr:TolC family protein [Planctomycetaceae bacterium]